MQTRLRFVEEARHEAVREYRRYQREAGADIASRFREALKAAQIRVQAGPERYALYAPNEPKLEGVRKMQLRKYPHKLVYEILKGELVVYAVMHERRHPDYWKRRRDREIGT